MDDEIEVGRSIDYYYVSGDSLDGVIAGYRALTHGDAATSYPTFAAGRVMESYAIRHLCA